MLEVGRLRTAANLRLSFRQMSRISFWIIFTMKMQLALRSTKFETTIQPVAGLTLPYDERDVPRA